MAIKQPPERVFGEYTLKRKLGVGGMATVYYAIHNKLQQEVAIKIIHEHFADDSIAVKRLAREAHIAQKLKHPNIVPIITFNQVDNRPYLVMPYYAGKTLADYLEQPRSIPHTETLDILTQLADALDYAHSKGVIHRDFKLENILIGQNGDLAISDFGIAQIVNTTRLTATGNFVGTPHYMPPEQATNGYDEADYRADLYAFAVMAYLMLTGVFPFTGKDPIQLIIKHTTQAVPTPTLLNDKLPKAIDEVLIRALAKTPDYRYPNATEFVQALSNAFDDYAPITTLIDTKKINPIDASQPAEASILEQAKVYAMNAKQRAETEDFATNGRHKTRVIAGSIPAAGITKRQRNVSQNKSNPYVIILLIIILGSVALMLAIGRGDDATVNEVTVPELTESIVEDNRLIIERTQDVMADNPTATSSGLKHITIYGTPSTSINSNNSSNGTNNPQPTSVSNPISASNSSADAPPPPSSNNTVVLPTTAPVQATTVPAQPTSLPVQSTIAPTDIVEPNTGTGNGNSNGNGNGNGNSNGNGRGNGRGN